MSDFDFLHQSGGQQRPPSSPQMPRRQPAGAYRQVSAPSPHRVSVARRNPSQERFLGIVITLLKICGFLYLIVVLFGGIGLGFAIYNNDERSLGAFFWLVILGAGGSLACMAFAELIRLAIRAVHAVEETARILRSSQHG